MRVLIADNLAADTAGRLEAVGCAVTVDPSLQGDGLQQALARLDPQILVVRSTRVEAVHLAAARSLGLIIRGGAGVNTIDVGTASQQGVYVANCPGKNAIAVAELTMAHLLNMDRRLADNVAALREGRWDKRGFSKAGGLFGRTLAVLGTGQIGVEVIRRAQAFGLKVKAWSRSLSPEQADALGVTWCNTPLAAAAGADALTVHVALNDQTRGLVGERVLEALAPGAYVINTSRGGVVDEAALRLAIERRGIRAGLDVFEDEPGSGDVRFEGDIASLPGVYGTHHIGASTEQASQAVADEVVRVIQEVLTTGRVPNCVNLADRSPATHLLVVRHADEVGVLAGVFDLLRGAGISVQEMENIIFQGAQAACARISLDKAPPPQLLALIENSPHVFAASVVALEDK